MNMMRIEKKYGQLKILFLAFILLLTFNGFAKTTDGKVKEKAKTDSTATTNTSENENLEKLGFKNLFIGATANYVKSEPYETQVNPQAIPFIQEYTRKHGKYLESMNVWGQPYFKLYDQILSSYGLPVELKYLSVIESHLQSNLVSWVGAKGPWQFMPETGRQMGLVINQYTDERTDYYKSTHAAARYLKQLYNQLGDWLLVIAAYNGGPGRVFSAQKRAGSKNFWDLQYFLPTESRNHVKKFIGTHYIMEGGGGLTTVSRQEYNEQQKELLTETKILQTKLTEVDIANTETFQLEGKYNSLVLANKIYYDIFQFNKLNPNFDLQVVKAGGYNLRLPKDKMALFHAYRLNILNESILALMRGDAVTVTEYPSDEKITKKPVLIEKKKKRS